MRVILAEDEPIIRMDVRGLLEELGHQVVAECRDGAAAVAYTRQFRPDLVLMDINMPGTNGLEATMQITQQRLAPVVLLTSYCDGETVQVATNSGAFGYLIKPIDRDKLSPVIQVARQRFLEVQKLNADVKVLQEAIVDRQVISLAKMFLQQHAGYSEEEAFKLIRKWSMDQQRKMSDVAKDILRG